MQHWQKGDIAARAKDWQTALFEWTAVLQINKDDATAHYNRAIAMYNAGDKEGAAQEMATTKEILLDNGLQKEYASAVNLYNLWTGITAPYQVSAVVNWTPWPVPIEYTFGDGKTGQTTLAPGGNYYFSSSDGKDLKVTVSYPQRIGYGLGTSYSNDKNTLSLPGRPATAPQDISQCNAYILHFQKTGLYSVSLSLEQTNDAVQYMSTNPIPPKPGSN